MPFLRVHICVKSVLLDNEHEVKTVKEKIERYDELSESERLAVDLYVDQHPEYRELLRRYKRFDRLLRLARAKDCVATDDLARVVTAPYYSAKPTDDIEELEEEIRVAIRAEPALQEIASEYEARLSEVESAFDPSEHFSALRSAGRARAGSRPPSRTNGWGRSGGPSRFHSTPVSPSRLFLAALIGAVALFSSFAMLEGSRTSGVEQAADFHADELSPGYYSSVLFDADHPGASSSEAYFLDALGSLRQADQSVLGLLGSYDPAKLTAAVAALERVIELEHHRSGLAAEARLLLAKVLIHQNRLADARAHVRWVTEEDGATAERARELRETLETCCFETSP